MARWHGDLIASISPVWAHRRMLLTADDRLSRRQLARLGRMLATDDPTNEIGAAWGSRSCCASYWTARRTTTKPPPARAVLPGVQPGVDARDRPAQRNRGNVWPSTCDLHRHPQRLLLV
jgi:hypothetical protein